MKIEIGPIMMQPNGEYKMTVTLSSIDKTFDNLKGPLQESVFIGIRDKVIEHFSNEIINKNAHALWERVSMDTIARMVEISAGRKAILEAVK